MINIERDGRKLQIMPVDVSSFSGLLDTLNSYTEHLASALGRCKLCEPGVMCRLCFNALSAADRVKFAVQEALSDIEAISNSMKDQVETVGNA